MTRLRVHPIVWSVALFTGATFLGIAVLLSLAVWPQLTVAVLPVGASVAAVFAARSAQRSAAAAHRSFMLGLASRQRAAQPGAFLRHVADQIKVTGGTGPDCTCPPDDDSTHLDDCPIVLADQLGPFGPIEETDLAELEAEPVITYQLPGEPPTGRTVRSLGASAQTWRRLTDGTYQLLTSLDPDDVPGDVWGWGELLAEGRLQLLPLTPAERESELLYGPVNARWGNPDKPCPWAGCTLGVGHVGAHEHDGVPLGLTVESTDRPMGAGISPQESAAAGVCTCGRPASHEPHCPRYARLSGTAEGLFTPRSDT